jgi:two-component system cell cycle sensor histidine kinase PleC
VKDNGIGIASENIERVLRPFEQVESAHARLHNGAGLGLPFAKKVIELHGGRLVLDSALDAGTSVRFMLPASRVSADDAPDEGAGTAARF